MLWLDLLKDGYKAAGCTEILAEYRQVPGSRAANKINAAKHRWIIYRKHLKLPLVKSIRTMAVYAAGGVKKYYRV